MHASFWTVVLSRYTPRSGLLGSYGNSISSFLRNIHTVFHHGWTNISINSLRGFLFLHTVSRICCCRLFNDDWCEVVPHCSFSCIFLIISDIEHLSIYYLAICMSSLEKCLLRSSVHFSIGQPVINYKTKEYPEQKQGSLPLALLQKKWSFSQRPQHTFHQVSLGRDRTHACSWAGLWPEGWNYFDCLKQIIWTLDGTGDHRTKSCWGLHSWNGLLPLPNPHCVQCWPLPTPSPHCCQ